MEENIEGDSTLFGRITESTGLFIGAGLMRGIDAGARVTVLHERGVRMRRIWACSTGGPAAYYYASGQPRIGTSIYPDECCTDRFFSKSPQRFIAGTTMDAAYLTRDVFASSEKALNLDALYAFGEQGTISLGVSNYETGKGKWMNVFFQGEDPLKILEASIAAPGLYRVPVMLAGERWIDGGISCPFPDPSIIDTCDSWIVFANRPRVVREDMLGARRLMRTMSVMLPAPTRAALAIRHEVFEQNCDSLRRSRKPYCIIWSDPRIQAFTMDPAILDDARMIAEVQMHRILDRAGV